MRDIFEGNGAEESIPEYWLPNNDADAPVSQPPNWKSQYPLRVEQLRSLGWMMHQENFGDTALAFGASDEKGKKQNGDDDLNVLLGLEEGDPLLEEAAAPKAKGKKRKREEKGQAKSEGVGAAAASSKANQGEYQDTQSSGGAAKASPAESKEAAALPKVSCNNMIVCEYSRFLPARKLFHESASAHRDRLGFTDESATTFCLQFDLMAQYELCGGLLCDEPGHGKTATTIGLILSDTVDLRKYMPSTLPDLPLRGTPNMKQIAKRIGQDPAAAKMTKTSTTNHTKTIDGIETRVCEIRTNRLIDPTIYELSNKDAPPGTVKAEDEAKQGSILQGKYNIQGYFPALNTTLILVPGRLLSQWVGEFEKFLTPERFNQLRIAQITKLEELEFLRVGDIQNFDVVLMAYSVFFHNDYRTRLRNLTGLEYVLENKCPRMNLLRHATGRFMKSTNSGDSSKAELKQELKALRIEFNRELMSKADGGGHTGAALTGTGGSVAKSKATNNKSSKKRKAEELEDEGEDGEGEKQEQDETDDAVALGENMKKGAVRQFWKAKLSVLDEEVNKWPSWWKRKVGTETHNWSEKAEKPKYRSFRVFEWNDMNPQPAPGKYPRGYATWVSYDRRSNVTVYDHFGRPYQRSQYDRNEADHPLAGVGYGKWEPSFPWYGRHHRKMNRDGTITEARYGLLIDATADQDGVWQHYEHSLKTEEILVPKTKHLPLTDGEIPKKPLYQNFVFPVLEQVSFRSQRMSIRIFFACIIHNDTVRLPLPFKTKTRA